MFCVYVHAHGTSECIYSLRGCAMDAGLIRLSLCAVLAPGVVVPRTTPAPEEVKSNVVPIVLGLVGAAMGIGLLVAGYLYWKSKSSKSGEFETTYLSGGADSASTSNMQWPAVAPSESRKGGFSAFRSPMTPHTAISTSSATPAAGTLQMGSDNTPSVPAPALTLDTFQPSAQRPPQSSDWMEPTTPPGTPPGEPPEYLDDSPADSYVRGELVFAENLNTTNQPGLATFTQLLPWQRAPRDAGVGLPQASGGPARDMRRNLEDADKGQMLYPALQVGPWASADAPMNMPVMSSSNQLHEVKMTQEESQNDLSASDVDDLQLLPERPSSDLPAAVPWSSRDSTGVVSMMAGPPAQSFGGNLFSSMEPSLQESASDTAKDAGAVEI